MKRLHLTASTFAALFLISCQSAPAGPTSTNWQQLAKKFSTHHTAKFQWDISGLPRILRGPPSNDDREYGPLDPIEENARYLVWMDLEKPWMAMQGGNIKYSFPEGTRISYMHPSSKRKRPTSEKIPPMLSGPITSLLKIFATGFESCNVEAPVTAPRADHYGGHHSSNTTEWAKLDCKELQKGFGNPLYISYRSNPMLGPYPEQIYFETKAVKNVPSYQIHLSFSRIIWDEKFEETVYSTEHHGDRFERPLTPWEAYFKHRQDEARKEQERMRNLNKHMRNRKK